MLCDARHAIFALQDVKENHSVRGFGKILRAVTTILALRIYLASRDNSSQEPMTIAMGKPLITYSLLEVDGIRGGYEGRQHGVTALFTISGLHHTHRHMTRTWNAHINLG